MSGNSLGGAAFRFLLSANQCGVIHARTAMGAIRGPVEVAIAVGDATGDLSRACVARAK